MVHNARVKLVATALNNLGVAAIIYGIIAPRLNGQGDDPVVFLFGFTAGIVSSYPGFGSSARFGSRRHNLGRPVAGGDGIDAARKAKGLLARLRAAWRRE